MRLPNFPKSVEGVDDYCNRICGIIHRHNGMCKKMCARRARMMAEVTAAAINHDRTVRIERMRRKNRRAKA